MDFKVSMLTGLEKLFYIFIRDNGEVTLNDLYLFYGKDDAYARRVIKRLILKKLISKRKSTTNRYEIFFKVKKYIE